MLNGKTLIYGREALIEVSFYIFAKRSDKIFNSSFYRSFLMYSEPEVYVIAIPILYIILWLILAWIFYKIAKWIGKKMEEI